MNMEYSNIQKLVIQWGLYLAHGIIEYTVIRMKYDQMESYQEPEVTRRISLLFKYLMQFTSSSYM